MPEGDTIWRTAAALRQRIGGKMVNEARPAAIARLKGRRVESVEPNGKHLVMQFEGGIALHSHMRMTGAWHLYRPGEHWRQPSWRATAVLGFDDVVAVCFAAPVMELVRDASAPVAHLGPDILVEPFDLDTVIRRARQSGAPTLGELLLEQRVCAGIGNIYKCEALWALGLDAWMPQAELDDGRLRQLYLTARDLMRRNLVTRGKSRDPDEWLRGKSRDPDEWLRGKSRDPDEWPIGRQAACRPRPRWAAMPALRDANSNTSTGAAGPPYLFLPALPGRTGKKDRQDPMT